MRSIRAEVYKGKDNDWHWRALASNDLIIADSAEGYENQQHAMKMARKVLFLPKWKVKVV